MIRPRMIAATLNSTVSQTGSGKLQPGDAAEPPADAEEYRNEKRLHRRTFQAAQAIRAEAKARGAET